MPPELLQGAAEDPLWFLLLAFFLMNLPTLLFLVAPPSLVVPCGCRMGHCDSLERRGAVDVEKQRVLPLHCNRKATAHFIGRF